MLPVVKARLRNLKLSGRELILLGCFAFFLCLSTIVGYSSIAPKDLGWGALLGLFPFLFFFLFFLVSVSYSLLRQRSCSCALFGFYTCSRFKYWLIPALIIALAWMLSWLSFWPGIYTSDTTDCIAQSLGVRTLSAHHPVCFTLLMAPFMNIANSIGNLEYGLAAFSLFQLLFLASVCSYVVFWIKARTDSSIAALATFAFFVLNPVIAQYAISAWKDIWFSGFLLLFSLSLFDCILALTRNRPIRIQQYLCLGAFGIAAMLFRSNGLIIVLLVLIAVCIAFAKIRKQIILLTASLLTIFICVTGPGYAALNVRSASFAETVGIPIQQLSKAYMNEGIFSESTTEYLDNLMDKEEVRSVFDPHLVDPIKWAPNFNRELLNSDKGRFVLAWVESMPANLPTYFSAWRDITLGYWYVGASDWIVANPGYESIDILETSDQIRWPSDRHQGSVSLIGNIPFLSQNSAMAQIDLLRATPPVGLIFNIAFLAWLTIGVCIFLCCRKSARFALAVSPFVVLWLTMLLAAPTFCQFRYMFSLELALPFLVAMIAFSFYENDHRRT